MAKMYKILHMSLTTSIGYVSYAVLLTPICCKRKLVFKRAITFDAVGSRVSIMMVVTTVVFRDVMLCKLAEV
jgi:hypothetical protein